MKQNDIGTTITFTVVDSCGSVVNLLTATTVKLKFSVNGANTFDRVISFLDRPNGKVFYTIQSGDLSTTGMARMELQVGFSSGKIFSSERVFAIVEPSFSF